MSIFDWFRQAEATPYPDDIKDEKLGRLSYAEVILSGDEVTVWQGLRQELNGKRIQVTIEGDREGPDPELREMFVRLRAEHEEYRDSIRLAFQNITLPPPEDAELVPQQVHVLRCTDTNQPYIQLIYSADHPEDEGNPYSVKLVEWKIEDAYRW